MSSDSILKKKSFDFAVRVINLCKYLKDERKEYIVSQQILRSGTAIGSLIREAEFAESRKDFLHKMNISLKEANESIYWVQLLYATDLISKTMFDSLEADATELVKMLVKSIKTLNGET